MSNSLEPAHQYSRLDLERERSQLDSLIVQRWIERLQDLQ